MVWVFLIIGLAALGVIYCRVAYVRSNNGEYGYGYGDKWLVLGLISGAIFLFVGLVPIITYPSRAVGRTTCRNWGEATGYQTKFRILNWADGGTCLALAPNGRWVPNTNIIINAPSK